MIYKLLNNLNVSEYIDVVMKGKMSRVRFKVKFKNNLVQQLKYVSNKTEKLLSVKPLRTNMERMVKRPHFNYIEDKEYLNKNKDLSISLVTDPTLIVIGDIENSTNEIRYLRLQLLETDYEFDREFSRIDRVLVASTINSHISEAIDKIEDMVESNFNIINKVTEQDKNNTVTTYEVVQLSFPDKVYHIKISNEGEYKYGKSTN